MNRRPRIVIRSRLLAAALLLALPLTAHAQAPRKLTVVLGYIPNVEMYGPEYALIEGLFKAEGLDVTLVPAGQGVNQVQMVAAGVADIGIANPESILAAAGRGEKFKIFASQFQTSPVAMTCRKDSGVTKATELKGKRIGVKVAAKPYLDLLLSKNGLKDSDVTTTTIGGTDIAVLISGRIDCQVTTFAFNEPRLIENAGVPVNVLPLGSFGLNAQTDSYFVKASFLDNPANADVLVRFLRTQGQAWDSFFKDPSAAAAYVINKKLLDGLDIEQQTYQAIQQAKFMKSPLTAEKGILWINPATFKETAENLFAAKVTDTLVDPTDLLTMDILEKASLPKL
jgi:NitT/TauT family transport system substrate-binding protein